MQLLERKREHRLECKIHRYEHEIHRFEHWIHNVNAGFTDLNSKFDNLFNMLTSNSLTNPQEKSEGVETKGLYNSCNVIETQNQ